MKILWITNTIFPEFAKYLEIPVPFVGGWMFGLGRAMARFEDIELTVATVTVSSKDQTFVSEGITHYLIKGSKIKNKYDKRLEPKWKRIIDEVQPDVIHMHGSEYAHGLSLMKVYPEGNFVVSIQGLISVYTRYYLARLGRGDILSTITIRDLIKRDSILDQHKEFKIRGETVELPILKGVKHIIGRTSWDYSHAKAINPTVNYHFQNESLRDPFYSSTKWSFDNCTPYTIFISQSTRPLKGLHQVIKAVSLINEDYPKIQLRIAGSNIIRPSRFGKRPLKGYGVYIKKLGAKLGLLNQMTFLGGLTAEQMISEYLNCHLFICPSSIENSPNSLGEAQILGTPIIASYTGGIPDMVTHKITGLLYRFEEHEMLAQEIKRIFDSQELSKSISQEGIEVATIRHNRETNSQRLHQIYKIINNH
jgi:glycosyltransferase involved in cell wall biosynthesis